MQLELKRIQHEVGITFIYVTHDQEEAMTMSDRIAVMNRGRYEQLADPETLYERPATRFVAGFLGISNLLRGTVVERTAEQAAIRLVDGEVVRAPAAAVRGATDLEVGVRPEKLRLFAAGMLPPAGFNVVAGTVRDASYLGVSTQYVIETRAGGRLIVYEQNVERTSHGSLHRPGEEVRVAWAPDYSFAVAPSRTGAAEEA
jgi:spermidine/putrescine transport system ATP-binding protein